MDNDRLDPSTDKGWDAVAFGRRIPFPFSLILTALFIPLLAIGAVISVPVTYVRRYLVRYSERRCMERMKAVGRYISLEEVLPKLEGGDGTFIGEYLTAKGPFRLWWTTASIASSSPFLCCTEDHPWWCEQDYSDFFGWCAARFTNVDSGIAYLIDVPENGKAFIYK